MLIVLERFLEVREISLLVRTRDRAHALYVSQLRILRRRLDGDKRSHVHGLQTRTRRSGIVNTARASATYEVKHDFAEQHVLERAESARVVLRAQVLEHLVEVEDAVV